MSVEVGKSALRTATKQRLFAICGIVAPIFFALMVIVESLLRPGYSQISDVISDLGSANLVGPSAILQDVNFVVFGVLSVCFALALRGGLPGPRGRSSKIGIVFVALFGLSIVLAGIFQDSPSPYPSDEHSAVSLIAFFSIIAAQLSIWRALGKTGDQSWAAYSRYSLTSGILSIVFLLVAIFTNGQFPAYKGATQRVFLTVPWIWIGVTSVKLYRSVKMLA